MRIEVGGVRLFFDVEGAKLIPDGPWMRERPTAVLLHPGPGFDHAPFRVGIGPWLASSTQVVYLDMRGSGRSDSGPVEEHRLERWSEDVREFCDVLGIVRPVVLGLGFGSMVALDYAARHPQHPGALVLLGPVARIVPERSIAVYEQLGGEEARDVARRFYAEMDDRVFADFVRVCFPLLSNYPLTSDVIARADWNPDVLMRWMRGEAKKVDLRGVLGAVEAPVLVLAGEDDAWAPLVSVREVVDLLPGTTGLRTFEHARHSVLRDAPEAYDELRTFLDELQSAGEAGA